MFSRYAQILSLPGVRPFVAWGMLARVQMGMTGLSTILLVQLTYGSYAAAGAVLAAISVSYAVIAPQVARLVDVHGQSRVLRIGYAIAITGRLALIAAVLTHQPVWALLALAPLFAAGGSQSTLTRARWSHALKDRRQLDAAFALESSLEEVLWVVGPVLATALAVGVAPWAPSVLAVLALAVGGYVFLSLKDSEPSVRSKASDAGLTEASLSVAPATAAAGIALPPVTGASARRVRGYRNPFKGHLLVTAPTLAIAAAIFLTQGVIFASIDASVVAFSTEAGAASAAGIVLAVWAAGGLVGGVAYGTRVWSRTLATRLFWGITATGVGAAMLGFAPSLLLLACMLFLTGLFVAPTMVIGDTLVGATVARNRMTEGMTWTRTGIDLGVAAGAWITGLVVDGLGAGGGFMVTASAAVAGIAIVGAGWHFIRRQPARVETEAIPLPSLPQAPVDIVDSPIPTPTLELPQVNEQTRRGSNEPPTEPLPVLA